MGKLSGVDEMWFNVVCNVTRDYTVLERVARKALLVTNSALFDEKTWVLGPGGSGTFGKCFPGLD